MFNTPHTVESSFALQMLLEGHEEKLAERELELGKLVRNGEGCSERAELLEISIDSHKDFINLYNQLLS
jgi:hypothetical protein